MRMQGLLFSARLIDVWDVLVLEADMQSPAVYTNAHVGGFGCWSELFAACGRNVTVAVEAAAVDLRWMQRTHLRPADAGPPYWPHYKVDDVRPFVELTKFRTGEPIWE